MLILYVYFFGLGLEVLRDRRLPLIHIEQLLPELKVRRKAAPVPAGNNESSNVIDFAETKVFDAVVEPAIMVLRKAKQPDAEVRCIRWNETQALEELPEIVTARSQVIKQNPCRENLGGSWAVPSHDY